jgi:hypothetical protein
MRYKANTTPTFVIPVCTGIYPLNPLRDRSKKIAPDLEIRKIFASKT